MSGTSRTLPQLPQFTNPFEFTNLFVPQQRQVNIAPRTAPQVYSPTTLKGRFVQPTATGQTISRKTYTPYTGQPVVNSSSDTLRSMQPAPSPMGPPKPPPYTGTAGYWANYNKVMSGLPADVRAKMASDWDQYQFENPQNLTGQPVGTAGYWGQFNQPAPTGPGVNTSTSDTLRTAAAGEQPFLGSSSYLDPRWQAGATSPKVNGVSVPPRPVDVNGQDIVYTGDPKDPNTQKWKDYWNEMARLQATNPEAYAAIVGAPPPPKVMTLEEIWQMKAEQRRRAMDAAAEDGAGYSSPTTYDYGGYADPLNTYAYPDAVRQLIWSP